MHALSHSFVADSHLHVWGDGSAPFPYAEGQEPPQRLRQSGTPETLLAEMDNAGVGGALIVQVGLLNNRMCIDTLRTLNPASEQTT